MDDRTEPETPRRDTARRRRPPLYAAAAAAALAAVFYLWGAPANPPGFFVDESSIAYNAHAVSQSGRDEHGEPWPLFFRAFGEYKNPVYLYLLAALFKLTGPSITAARLLSATAGLLAALLLGLLAARAAKSSRAGAIVFVTSLLTPWLFELSRLVFEVALVPLALALFLLALHFAAGEEDWSWPRALLLGALLGLITYTYSAGRLLAPLLALGLLLFATRRRWRGVARAWAAYAAALVPLFVFIERHPGALGARFYDVTFVKPTSTAAEIVSGFLMNYAGSFSPWNWLAAGDPEPRHHVAGMGSMLVGAAALGLAGLVLVLARHRRDAWWRFVLYGTAVAAVPAALTLDRFHTLRLVAVPVFFLTLAAPAAAWLAAGGAKKRAALVLLVALVLLQGALFRRQFEREAPRRWHNFDTFYPEVFEAAAAVPQRPIYLLDAHAAPGYVHAYWYGLLRGMDASQFVRLPKDARPPAGALVISTELPCTDCRLLLHRGPFRAYIAQ